MPGTFTPAQMFDHELNAVKGWPSPYAVDKVKPIAAGEQTIFAGSVVYIDPLTDTFKLGLPYTGGADAFCPMPIFAFPNSTDYDVLSDVGNIAGGNLVGLVAVGAYELETTQFVGLGFTSGAPLTVVNTPGADKGKVTATGATLLALSGGDSDCVVGIVSDNGPLTNEWQKQFVRFWPWYLPLGHV
jgi:hypothetical protein